MLKTADVISWNFSVQYYVSVQENIHLGLQLYEE